jgi:hypothetical protein
MIGGCRWVAAQPSGSGRGTIILLSAPARTIVKRLAARTGNPYGKAPGDMDRILADLGTVEPLLRRAADHEIRTTVPLTDVVAEVVRLTRLPPGRHDTVRHHPADSGA